MNVPKNINASFYHRARAYGLTRIDHAEHMESPADLHVQWKPPLRPFPLVPAGRWKPSVEYRVSDFAAEVGFYADVLGLNIIALSSDYALFSVPDGDFTLSIAEADESTATPGDALRVVFFTADIEAAVHELAARGIPCELPLTPVEPGQSLLTAGFRTPHGIAFDLYGEAGPDSQKAATAIVNQTTPVEKPIQEPHHQTESQVDQPPARSLQAITSIKSADSIPPADIPPFLEAILAQRPPRPLQTTISRITPLDIPEFLSRLMDPLKEPAVAAPPDEPPPPLPLADPLPPIVPFVLPTLSEPAPMEVAAPSPQVSPPVSATATAEQDLPVIEPIRQAPASEPAPLPNKRRIPSRPERWGNTSPNEPLPPVNPPANGPRQGLRLEKREQALPERTPAPALHRMQQAPANPNSKPVPVISLLNHAPPVQPPPPRPPSPAPRPAPPIPKSAPPETAPEDVEYVPFDDGPSETL